MQLKEAIEHRNKSITFWDEGYNQYSEGLIKEILADTREVRVLRSDNTLTTVGLENAHLGSKDEIDAMEEIDTDIFFDVQFLIDSEEDLNFENIEEELREAGADLYFDEPEDTYNDE